MQNRTATRSHNRTNNRATLPWQYMLLLVLCGCVLAAGFFFAARQHFVSMDYGFKNARLRKQVEDLEAEKRRLLLLREVALSPLEVRKSTRILARRESGPTPGTVQTAAFSTGEKKAQMVVAKSEQKATGVVRTSMSAPAVKQTSESSLVRKTADMVARRGTAELSTLAKLR